MADEAIKHRAAVMWSRIGERLLDARDRQEALKILSVEFGFEEPEGRFVLEMRVGDLVGLASADTAPSEIEDRARADWVDRGLDFTPGAWLPEERESWRQWIRDGVENQWLTVVRLRGPATLLGLERTNDDRSVYISHEAPEGSHVRIHTAIGGTYGIEDEHLAMELSERIDPGSDAVLHAAMTSGTLGLCDVEFDGIGLTGRSLTSQGWWAVAFAVDPTTTAFVTGQGAPIAKLDVVSVRSFEELSQPVEE